MKKVMLKVLVGIMLVAMVLSACSPAAPAAPAAPSSTDAPQAPAPADATQAPAAPAPATDAPAAPAVDTNRVVNVAYPQICKHFDNTANFGIPEQGCLDQIYDGLLTKDFDGTLHPGLATEWKVSEDAATYDFKLREDVKWSDGEPFTAEDVKASFDYYASQPAVSWFYADVIKETNVIDPYNVQIVLHKPNVPFLRTMGQDQYGFIMAKHILEKYGDQVGRTMESVVGTGPYVLTDWKTDTSVTFKAKEDYWREPAEVKNLVFHRIPDMNAAVVALQTGELDVYYNPVKGTAYETLKAAPNVKIEEFVSARNEGVFMYNPSGTFSDVRMRKAVAYAVSKEDMITVAAEGLGSPIQYPGDIGPRMAGNPDKVPSITYNQDLDKARALVKEAGMEGAEVVVKSYNTEPYATMGTYLQNVLTQIGLNAKVEQMERATFLDAMEKGEVEILPLAWVGSMYDIDEVLNTALYSKNAGTSANYSFYIDEEMDRLVDESRAVTNQEERLALESQIIEKFMAEVPFVSTYAVTYAIPHSAELTMDNPQSLSGYLLKWAK